MKKSKEFQPYCTKCDNESNNSKCGICQLTVPSQFEEKRDCLNCKKGRSAAMIISGKPCPFEAECLKKNQYDPIDEKKSSDFVMTDRDKIALEFAKSLIARDSLHGCYEKGITVRAYSFADEFIKQSKE